MKVPIACERHLCSPVRSRRARSENVMLLGWYLGGGSVHLLGPLADLRVGAVGFGFLNDQFLAFGPIERQGFDGLDDAMTQDRFNGHISSRVEHRIITGLVNSRSVWANP